MADTRFQQNFPEASIRDFYNVLFRNKRKILVFFFSVVVIVTVGTLLTYEIYRSEATLLVRLGRESVSLDPTATTGQVLNIGQDRENEINSEASILMSRELAEKIVDVFGADKLLEHSPTTAEDPPLARFRYFVRSSLSLPLTALSRLLNLGDDQSKKRDKAVRLFIKTLEVGAAKKSNIIAISYESQSPKLARDIVATLIDFYLDKHINAHRTKGSFQFFDQQREQLHTTLAGTEEELKNLKNESGVASLTDQRRILLERTGSLRRDLEKTESDLAASEANSKVLQRKLADAPQTLITAETIGLPNTAADELHKRMNDLQLKEQELLSTFMEQSIPVTEIRRQIAEARSMLAKAEQSRQVTTGINMTYQEIRLLLMKEEANLSALKARASVLREQIAEAGNELKLLNNTETRLTQLQREFKIQETNYRKYAESLEQARIDQSLELEKISNISVVQPASYAIKPVRPNKLIILPLGLFLGIFGAIGFAFIAEYLNHSFNKTEDVENRLQIPTVAAIPYLPAQNGLPACAAIRAGLAQPLGDFQVMSTTEGRSPTQLIELSNFMMQWLSQSSGDPSASARTLAVTSCHAGEGVSTVVAYLASLLAEQGAGRIIVVDANLRCPAQQAYLEVLNSQYPGKVPASRCSNASAIQQSSLKNVDLLATEKFAVDSARNGDLKAIEKLLFVLKREYSHVIFDIPALWDDSASINLARAMDGVILVIEAGSTRWEVAQRSKDRLLETSANVLGVVLNKQRHFIPERLYRTL